MGWRGGGFLVDEGGGRILASDGKGIRYSEGQAFPRVTSVVLVDNGGGKILATPNTGDETGGLLVTGISPDVSTTGSFDDDAIFPPQLEFPPGSGVLVQEDFGQGIEGGPGWRTVVQETADGTEFRIGKWGQPELSWDAVSSVFTPLQLKTTLDFYRARRGSLHGFRFTDPFDNSTRPDHFGAPVANNQAHRHVIGASDGNADLSGVQFFQLVKHYSFTSPEWESGPTFTRKRPITRPRRPIVGGTQFIFADGVQLLEGTNYFIDYEGGRLGLVHAPVFPAGTVIEWAGTFDVPARFGVALDNSLITNIETTELQVPDSLPIIEIDENVEFYHHPWHGGAVVRNFGVDEFINLQWGRFQLMTPTLGGLTLRLPTTDDLLDGGPVVYLMNGSGGTTFRVATSDGNDTTVISALAPQDYAIFWLRSDNSWLAAK